MCGVAKPTPLPPRVRPVSDVAPVPLKLTYSLPIQTGDTRLAGSSMVVNATSVPVRFSVNLRTTVGRVMYPDIVAESSSLKLNGKPTPMPLSRSITEPMRADPSITSVADSAVKFVGSVFASARSAHTTGIESICIQ